MQEYKDTIIISTGIISSALKTFEWLIKFKVRDEDRRMFFTGWLKCCKEQMWLKKNKERKEVSVKKSTEPMN